jgi:hypothetical protein
MRTILAGLVLVLLFYVLATTVIARIAGSVVALAYFVSLPIAADVDLRFTERMHRARQRMRAYLRFRRNPELGARLVTEHQWLTTEVSELARMLASTG